MVFLFILSTIVFIMILLVFSRLQISISNFRFNSQIERHVNEDYEVIIKLYILRLLPVLKASITKNKLEKIGLKEKIKNIDLKLLQSQQKFDKRAFSEIKALNIEIKNLNLHVDLGTENAALTSIIVPTISTIITFVLRKKIKNLKNQKFIIEPIYQNQNLVNIYFSGIFEIKMRHIINIIYNLSKKENKGVNKYERTSNRGAYDYSYE